MTVKNAKFIFILNFTLSFYILIFTFYIIITIL